MRKIKKYTNKKYKAKIYYVYDKRYKRKCPAVKEICYINLIDFKRIEETTYLEKEKISKELRE